MSEIHQEGKSRWISFAAFSLMDLKFWNIRDLLLIVLNVAVEMLADTRWSGYFLNSSIDFKTSMNLISGD